ncbi:alpha/beta fold hydrolase [Metabacillus sp. HB246100]|uniref:alpha/beta fold hydrolase n=1 Tax=Bacillus weihaiensis TaxID=1547283 RepID=UPI0023549141|nr:alpha/beta hydrolase [Bacillus weihaiensis]
MEHYTLNVGDNMISYTDQGVGHCVVLIHGFCGDSQYWKYIVPQLVAKNRVITVDIRGHGHSSTPKDEFEIMDLADDLDKLLTSLHIDRATLIGHSLGGYISIAFAEKYPEKLCGLSMVHSTTLPDTDEAKKNRDNGILLIEEEGIKPYIQQLIPKLFAAGSHETLANEIDLVKKIGYRTSDLGAIECLKSMKNRPNRNHVLKNLSLPVLLVAGELDDILPLERTFSVSGTNISQHTIKESGHMSMLEKPDELSEVLIGFLDNIIDSKMI